MIEYECVICGTITELEEAEALLECNDPYEYGQCPPCFDKIT